MRGGGAQSAVHPISPSQITCYRARPFPAYPFSRFCSRGWRWRWGLDSRPPLAQRLGTQPPPKDASRIFVRDGPTSPEEGSETAQDRPRGPQTRRPQEGPKREREPTIRAFRPKRPPIDPLEAHLDKADSSLDPSVDSDGCSPSRRRRVEAKLERRKVDTHVKYNMRAGAGRGTWGGQVMDMRRRRRGEADDRGGYVRVEMRP